MLLNIKLRPENRKEKETLKGLQKGILNTRWEQTKEVHLFAVSV